ncbi:hypothetical protein B0O80DRAFT_270335 [Mortierella sp. GBAus27b]|nr:hypothetical protein B0O80DRAFT_270335 [Mortierella sp. GBAus27b]
MHQHSFAFDQGSCVQHTFEDEHWNAFEALVRRNLDCLRSLTLMGWGERFGNPFRRIWNPLHTCAQHANFSTLRMERRKFHARDFEAFWTICRKLEVLELTEMDMRILSPPSDASSIGTSRVHFHGYQPGNNWTGYIPTHGTTTTTTTPAAVRFPNLRELKLDRILPLARDQLEQLIIQCPMLHTLVWRLVNYKFSLDDFCDYYAAQTWPHFDALEIAYESKIVSDQECVRLLRSTKRPFKFLDLDLGAVKQSLDLLREGGHFETLTKVDLSIPFRESDHMLSMDNGNETASRRIRSRVLSIIETHCGDDNQRKGHHQQQAREEGIEDSRPHGIAWIHGRYRRNETSITIHDIADSSHRHQHGCRTGAKQDPHVQNLIVVSFVSCHDMPSHVWRCDDEGSIGAATTTTRDAVPSSDAW